MMNETDLLLSEQEFLTESVGSGRSGSLECNDITSVFAFLAFLFALLNFVVNMGGQGGRRRRRRGVEGEQCYLDEDQLDDPLYRSSLLSVYALYRGVLNYMDLLEVEDAGGGCRARVLCEAGHQAAGGELGPVIALLGAHRAGWMFETLGVGSHRDTVRAVTTGMAGSHCQHLYPCLHHPLHHPQYHTHGFNFTEGSDRGLAQLERIRQHIRQFTIISK